MKVIQADYHQPKHGQDIMFLMQTYAQDEMGGGEELSEYTQQNLIANLQSTSGVFTVIAYDGELAIGLINCVEGFSTFKAKKLVNIHDVIVLEEYRGKGVVDRMFAEVERLSQALGACKLTLEVLEGNTRAQKAYQRLGFEGYELAPKMGKALFCQKTLS